MAATTAIALTPNGKTLYVGTGSFAAGEDDAVTPVSTTANRPGKAIRVGQGLNAIVITPNGKTAYVSSSDAGTVTPIRIATSTAGRPSTSAPTSPPTPSRSRPTAPPSTRLTPPPARPQRRRATRAPRPSRARRPYLACPPLATSVTRAQPYGAGQVTGGVLVMMHLSRHWAQARPRRPPACRSTCSGCGRPGGGKPVPRLHRADRLGVELELGLGAARPDHHPRAGASCQISTSAGGTGRPGERSPQPPARSTTPEPPSRRSVTVTGSPASSRGGSFLHPLDRVGQPGQARRAVRAQRPLPGDVHAVGQGQVIEPVGQGPAFPCLLGGQLEDEQRRADPVLVGHQVGPHGIAESLLIAVDQGVVVGAARPRDPLEPGQRGHAADAGRLREAAQQRAGDHRGGDDRRAPPAPGRLAVARRLSAASPSSAPSSSPVSARQPPAPAP